jgi:hypothetical protein
MEHSEEEIQRFVDENRDLIEVMMDRAAPEGRNVGEPSGDRIRSRVEEDALRARARMEKDTRRAEDAFREVFEAFADPEVQRHFMSMGMSFFLGVSALMRRMPAPDFVKSTASDMESSWKEAACRSNEGCSARRRRIDIDDGVSKMPIDVQGDEDGHRAGEGGRRIRAFRHRVGDVWGPHMRGPQGPCVRRASRRLRDAEPPSGRGAEGVHRVSLSGHASGEGDRGVRQVSMPRSAFPGPFPGGGRRRDGRGHCPHGPRGRAEFGP